MDLGQSMAIKWPSLEADQNRLFPITVTEFIYLSDPVGTSRLLAQKHQLLQQPGTDPGRWVSSTNIKCRLSKVKAAAFGKGKTHLLNKDGRANPAPSADERHSQCRRPQPNILH